MSASPSTDPGRMKGLIGFWNSKSVSETKSFRPSAVSHPSKSMKSSLETIENKLMTSSPESVENNLMKSSPTSVENNLTKSSVKPLKNRKSKTNLVRCIENKPRKGSTEKIQNSAMKITTKNNKKCFTKEVSGNYLTDRVNKIENERREMDRRFGERGNGLGKKLVENSKDNNKEVVNKHIHEGNGATNESQKLAVNKAPKGAENEAPKVAANKAPKVAENEAQKVESSTKQEQRQLSFSKTPTVRTDKTRSALAKFKEIETKNSTLLETGNRGSLGRNKTFSVRFPSPCSEPTSPSTESRVKKNLAARSESTAKEIIMNWVKEMLKDYPIPMTNFSSCWNDGLAFCALVHSVQPSALDWHQLHKDNRRHNFQLAFQKAEEFLDIYPLLEVDDMVRMTKPDWKCVFTYVQSFYRRFRSSQQKKISSPSSSSSNTASISSMTSTAQCEPQSASATSESFAETCQARSVLTSTFAPSNSLTFAPSSSAETNLAPTEPKIPTTITSQTESFSQIKTSPYCVPEDGSIEGYPRELDSNPGSQSMSDNMSKTHSDSSCESISGDTIELGPNCLGGSSHTNEMDPGCHQMPDQKNLLSSNQSKFQRNSQDEETLRMLTDNIEKEQDEEILSTLTNNSKYGDPIEREKDEEVLRTFTQNSKYGDNIEKNITTVLSEKPEKVEIQTDSKNLTIDLTFSSSHS